MENAAIEPTDDKQNSLKAGNGRGATIPSEKVSASSSTPQAVKKTKKSWRGWALALLLSVLLNVGLFVGFRDVSARLDATRQDNSDVRLQIEGLQASVERGEGAVAGSMAALEQVNRDLDDLIARASRIREVTTLALTDVRAADSSSAVAVVEGLGVIEAEDLREDVTASPVAASVNDPKGLIGQESVPGTLATPTMVLEEGTDAGVQTEGLVDEVRNEVTGPKTVTD